ncbi:unnamed protein product [Prunus armeniaca]
MGWLCLLFLLFTTCQFNSTCSSSSNSSSSLSSGHLCHPHDSSALLQFKNSFFIHTSSERELYNGATLYSNSTITWEKGKDCCAWSGVTCEKMNGHVIGLNLHLVCFKAISIPIAAYSLLAISRGYTSLKMISEVPQFRPNLVAL